MRDTGVNDSILLPLPAGVPRMIDAADDKGCRDRLCTNAARGLGCDAGRILRPSNKSAWERKQPATPFTAGGSWQLRMRGLRISKHER